MSITLTKTQEQFIQAKLQTGKYRSAEEVLEVALRLLDEYDRTDNEWLNSVRAKFLLQSYLRVELLEIPKAQQVVVTDDALTVDLSDGRTISVPLAWYPRLLHGTPNERNNWRFIGSNEGMHWPELDEDLTK